MAWFRDENGKKVSRNKSLDFTKKAWEKAQEFSRAIIEDPEYRQMLIRRAKAGILNASLEQMLWHYAYGKPQTTVEVNVRDKTADLNNLSKIELLERARALTESVAKIHGQELKTKEIEGPVN